MLKTLTQTVLFKQTTPQALYKLYMDAKLHTTVTGDIAKISEKEGAIFSAFSGYITGKNLQLVKNKLIVQSWKGSDWKKKDLDSNFILQFHKQGNDTLLIMVHTNVPEKHAKGIKDGWNTYYWKPWKEYLAKSRKK